MTAEQLELAPIHDHDPIESLEAARRVDAEGQLRKVMFALYDADRPLSDDDLAERCELLRTSAGTRRGVAQKFGWVEKAGRGVTPRGNSCGLWALSERGRRWVEQERWYLA